MQERIAAAAPLQPVSRENFGHGLLTGFPRRRRGRPRKITEQQVLDVLMGRARRGRSQVEHLTIAKRLNCSRDTVRRRLRSLKQNASLIADEGKKRRRFNRPNIYTFPNFAPQKLCLNTTTRKTRSGSLPMRPKAQSTYPRLQWEWRGAQMRAERRRQNHDPEFRKRVEQGWQCRRWRLAEAEKRCRWAMRAQVGMWHTFTPTPPESAEVLAAREAYQLREAERRAAIAAEAAAKAERERQEREDRARRLREEMAEPLSAELQAKVDALNRRLRFAGR